MPAPTSAAAGPAEGGPPRTELQELQLKAGQTTDEVSWRIQRYTYMWMQGCVYVCERVIHIVIVRKIHDGRELKST